MPTTFPKERVRSGWLPSTHLRLAIVIALPVAALFVALALAPQGAQSPSEYDLALAELANAMM